MLLTIVLLLVIMWALGFGFAGATFGSLLHLLLVIAIILFIYYLVTGRRVQ